MMKEFKDVVHVFRNNSKIEIGEQVLVYGYIYIKISDTLYENNASQLVKTHNCAPFRIFKKGVRRKTVRNQFGQKLK